MILIFRGDCLAVEPTDISSLDLTIRNRVRAIYFVPKDRSFPPEIQEQLDTFITIAQNFFRDEMAKYGKGKTFKYDADPSGHWKVAYMIGNQDASYYQQADTASGNLGGAAMAEIFSRIPAAFHNNNVTMYFYDQFVVSGTGILYSGQGGMGSPWEGPGAGWTLQGTHFLGTDSFDTVATTLAGQRQIFERTETSGLVDWTPLNEPPRILTIGEYASVNVGAAIHELGHAFYLNHVFTDTDGDGVENNIMGNGFRRFRGRFTTLGPIPATILEPESAQQLNNSIMFFVPTKPWPILPAILLLLN